jgi:aromatase
VRDGALLILEHEFEALADVTGIRDGVKTSAEAEELVAAATDENSLRELAAIRDVLERESGARPAQSLAAVFECETSIEGSKEDVYQALARISDWPGLLPHCRAIDMHYDDGHDQELTMTVAVGDRTERIRSIRHCDGKSTIRYFQPNPPPALKRHSGEWVVHEQNGAVRVVSRHEVELSPEGARETFGDVPPQDALASVESLIAANSARTLAAVKARVEHLF